MPGTEKRSEQDVIVLSLIAIYSVAVYAFAVIRMMRAEYAMVALDIGLATTSTGILLFTFKTRNTFLGSYFVAILITIGVVLTVHFKGVEQIYWAYPAVALLFYLLPPFHALYLWLVGAAFVVWEISNEPLILLLNILFTLSVTILFCLLFSFKMRKQNNNLKNISRRDVMTQLHNRRAFIEDMQELKQKHENMAAIVIDLDNFKKVNDRWGHAKGDDVLFEAAKSISAILDSRTSLYRVGGDEFIVLVADVEWQDVCNLSQSIHEQFSHSSVSKEHNITLSMAVGTKHKDESNPQWLNRLDKSLYRSKKSGRNQVIFMPDMDQSDAE